MEDVPALRSDFDPYFREDTIADVFEVPLLLSGGQISALERAGYRRGLTAAEMARQVLRAFIDDLSAFDAYRLD
ncbi:MAG: hypothetical protein U0736_09365 [Gemmataceae bacterium]